MGAFLDKPNVEKKTTAETSPDKSLLVGVSAMQGALARPFAFSFAPPPSLPFLLLVCVPLPHPAVSLSLLLLAGWRVDMEVRTEHKLRQEKKRGGRGERRRRPFGGPCARGGAFLKLLVLLLQQNCLSCRPPHRPLSPAPALRTHIR